jgi:hypothetical protein
LCIFPSHITSQYEYYAPYSCNIVLMKTHKSLEARPLNDIVVVLEAVTTSWHQMSHVSLVTRPITCEFWIWHWIYSPDRITLNDNTLKISVTTTLQRFAVLLPVLLP